MSLYAHIWLFIIYIQFAKSRFAPESRIPNSIGLAIYWGMLWEAYMGLFTEKKNLIAENYLKVLDVLEKLYEISDEGWFEVLHFLKNSNLESLTTYFYSDNIIPEVTTCNEVLVEMAYENRYNQATLKDALCAFIANNCDSLDGEHLENKIIAETELTQRFKQYAWLKNDIENLEDFKNLNIIESIQLKRPLRKSIKKTSISEVIYQNNNKYKELIWCLEDFSSKFNQPLNSLSKFLKSTKFSEHSGVYIRIGNGQFIELNKNNSEQSISFVLDFLDDSKFNSTGFDINTDYHHLSHILIDEDDLLYFPPLDDLIVDLSIGDTLYEGIRYGSIKLNKLEIVFKYHYQEIEKNIKDHWKKLENENLEQIHNKAISTPDYKMHPALDPSNPNHAPELLLAIQSWEARYLSNEYPHHEHTPALRAILKNKGHTNTRLIDRIAAITNPNKKI